MSTPTKLRPGNSELTKLKTLWRDSLSEDSRDYWRSLFVSADFTQAKIRAQIHARLKIKLDHDSQLNAFRDWEMEQRKMDLEAERAEEEERRLFAEHPEWTKEQVREELIKRFYRRAMATGDADLGLKTIVQDLNVEKVSLDSRKLALLEKKAAAFDQAKQVVESTLSPEEQKKRLKEILA